MSTGTLTVAAVDDHAVSLAGLSAMLAPHPEIQLVACAGTVVDLFAGLSSTPAVVLVDLRLADGSDPFDNVSAIKAAGAAALVFSALDSPYLIRRALAAGVHGLVNKAAPDTELVDAIAHAATGATYATADWASLIDSDPLTGQVDLTDRQRDILELYAMGEPAKRVATLLGLAKTTVQDHVDRIRAKYAAAGRPAYTKVDLLRRGMEDGFIKGPGDG
ncbi:LuxR C-terminal-related transcriptional regulator [Corynebacterium mendelii]|uniref:Response regulator transcription factor n=1 Tax=Corynebacterium mendelii TaxID=2765362 RepID=A0A939IYN1_9CORY|nr:LuxR C-terminal-related transcriptional regulator [Corynebacterium mendelii]MBN9644842.1 response regulator transcription factor [Corynebacterium mendelii]